MSNNSHSGLVTFSAVKCSMQDFAASLRRQLGRPVIDRTGLTGEFDFDMQWATDQAADTTLPSIYTAIQNLGLRLVNTRGPVETTVIDRVERASAN